MKTIMTVLGAFAIAFILMVFCTYPVMLLWNGCLVPAIETVNPITFWQSLGILVLLNILFSTPSKPSDNE